MVSFVFLLLASRYTCRTDLEELVVRRIRYQQKVEARKVELVKGKAEKLQGGEGGVGEREGKMQREGGVSEQEESQLDRKAREGVTLALSYSKEFKRDLQQLR